VTDQLTDSALLERLRRIDPLDPDELPSPGDTEAVLGGVLRRSAAGERPLSGPPRRRRPRMLIGATTAAAMLAVALALLLGTTATPPAFAVTDHHDGTVTVRLLKLSGITGANRRLAALGIRARIIRAVDLAPVVARLNPCLAAPAKSARTLSFNPRKIPPHRLLLLSADRTAHLTSVPGQVEAMRRARALVRMAKRLAKSAPRQVATLPAMTVSHAQGKLRSARGGTANSAVRIVCGRALTLRRGR
jgi:hypothetical protein